MAEAVAAHQLTVGDVVSVGGGVVGLPMKVTGLTSDEVLLESPTGVAESVARAGAEFRILRFASGIPNTPAIAWLDPDRREHVALQNGHPMNRGWLYNGDAVGETTILDVAAGMPIEGLSWAAVPRA